MADPMPNLTSAEEADLVAYADGRLEPDRRAALQARLDAEPALAAALARQRAGLTAIAGAVESTSAPLALRKKVETLQKPRARRSLRERLPDWKLGAVGLAAAAAVLLALVVAGRGPGVQDVVTAATRPPTAAIAPVPAGSKVLRERVQDVRYPNYLGKFGWRATGTRVDEIDGRQTRTVFYEKAGRTIAYTIVAGEALPKPDGAESTVDGVSLRSLQEDGRDVVTWERLGNTCVMSGKGVPEKELLELAAWKGMGDVAF